MNVLISTCVLVLTSAAVFGASLNAEPQKSYEREFANKRGPFGVANRQTRSLLDSVMPCVSIPHLTEMKGKFTALLDLNDDGKSTFEETKQFLQRFKENVKNATVESFIRRRDRNGDGMIQFVPEYVQSVSVHDTIEGAKEWFLLHDSNDDGFVSADELMRQGLAQGLSPEDASDYVNGYYMTEDANNDKQLTFDEFKNLYV